MPGPLAADPSADAGLVSISASQATYRCADRVVVALSGTAGAATAAGFASAQHVPLLLVTAVPDVALQTEIERLDPTTIVVGSGVEPSWFPDRSIEPLPDGPALLPQSVVASDPARVWLVAPESALAWPALWAVASATGDTAVFVPYTDLLAPEAEAVAEAIKSSDDAMLATVGLAPETAWHAAMLQSGHQLPGGGLLLFPDRRLLAFYGNPLTRLLGVLGEQGPDATIDRIQPFADEYAADRIPTIPAYEIIATVASAAAGPDGDYSEITDIEVIRPWVEVAGSRSTYVILDLQPGRTDFLTQAKLYENLLLEPHVGLALDPEWRLEPDQVHLRQIGTVDAAEINETVEWLAALVRDNGLPQKLLLLHQFNLDMITNRDQIATPPELAVAIHMDGDGTPGAKEGTWQVLTEGTAGDQFWWGWKNFFDEDEPMPGPDLVLRQEPTVYLVSFQ